MTAAPRPLLRLARPPPINHRVAMPAMRAMQPSAESNTYSPRSADRWQRWHLIGEAQRTGGPMDSLAGDKAVSQLTSAGRPSSSKPGRSPIKPVPRTSAESKRARRYQSVVGSPMRALHRHNRLPRSLQSACMQSRTAQYPMAPWHACWERCRSGRHAGPVPDQGQCRASAMPVESVADPAGMLLERVLGCSWPTRPDDLGAHRQRQRKAPAAAATAQITQRQSHSQRVAAHTQSEDAERSGYGMYGYPSKTVLN
jgi:hypothetical protein